MSEAESKGDIARDLPATDGHTPTPWEYRPHRFDDWGWIRGPIGDGDSIGPLVAAARSGKWQKEDELDRHRNAGTDPYGANAAFIVKAVNNHDALVECLQSIADMPDGEPREPDDADWRFRCLSAIEVAKRVLGVVGGSGNG